MIEHERSPILPDTDPTGADEMPAARRATTDRGYVLAMMGLLIVPLIAMTAFAVDLGAWYAQGTKMQRTVDAAALAGVVFLPDQTKATAAANSVITANGFSGAATIGFPAGGQRMQVSITRSAKQYFSKLFVSSESLTKSATAEFNKPVPLGSPANIAGNNIIDPATCPQSQPSQTAPCGPQPMLWQAIQGPYETHANGDAYATLCGRGVSAPGSCGTVASPSNTQYHPNGYQFAIEVAAADVGKPMTVRVYDAAEIGRTTGNSASGADCRSGVAPWAGGFPASFTRQNCQTGDSGPTDRNGTALQYQIFDNDGSDLTINFDTPLTGCELYIARDTAANPTVVSTYENKWVDICTFTPTKAGIYPMRVKSSNITRPNGTYIASMTSEAGWNAYSLKAVQSGGSPRLYSITDLSIWTNTVGSTARFYLAQIKPEQAGKTIVLDLFDPGDGTGGTSNYTLQVLAPPQSAPFNTPSGSSPVVPPQYGTVIPATGVASSCQANTTGSTTQGGGTLSNVANCLVTTRSGGSQIYQDLWLRYQIKIDPNYTCSTDCWWTIKYNFGNNGVPTDRTTWTLQVVGDPVHLIN